MPVTFIMIEEDETPVDGTEAGSVECEQEKLCWVDMGVATDEQSNAEEATSVAPSSMDAVPARTAEFVIDAPRALRETLAWVDTIRHDSATSDALRRQSLRDMDIPSDRDGPPYREGRRT
ncbi:MAG: hypothetical protein ACRDYC_03190 [Acidimicrobiales bacterium]